MNRKYLLRGIGIGLIIGCLVTYTAFRTGDYIKSEGTVATAEASNKDKKTEAKTTEAKTTEAKTTEAPSTETTTTEAKTTEKVTTEAKTTEATTEKVTTEAPTTEAPTTEEPTTEAPASKEISITVSAGMGSESVCSMLYEAGLISDENSYNLYLENNGYASNIKVGTFTFTKGMSEEEIAKVLTTQGQ